MEQKSDLLIHDFLQNVTDSVQYMRVMNIDAKSHLERPLDKCLQDADRAKNKMYLEACLQQSRYVYFSVVSVDRLMGV